MGCAGSRFDQLPVTGHASGLSVIPGSSNRYLKQENTVLKLEEKMFSFSGDDCSVKVSEPFAYIINYVRYVLLNLIALHFYYV